MSKDYKNLRISAYIILDSRAYFINKNVSWESYNLTKSGGGVSSDDGRVVKISNCDVHNLLYDRQRNVNSFHCYA